jgi:hypothetical protein
VSDLPNSSNYSMTFVAPPCAYLKSPIQASILNRFGDVRGLNFFRAGEVGNGAADFEHSAVGAGAEAELVDGGFQKPVAILAYAAVALEISGAHLCIGMDGSLIKALELDGACAVHSLANDRGGFARVFAGEFLITQGRHFDLNVNAIEQGA